MNEIRTAAVIGLGLMGGSVARDLAARGVRVLAYDLDPLARFGALRDRVAEAVLPETLAGVEEADLVVLAVPLLSAPLVLEKLAPRLNGPRLITDVGSTKRSVVAAAERLGVGRVFVGAHPVAGDHRSGWEASRRELFRDARIYLTPAPGADPGALELAARLWRSLGGRPEVIDVGEHDRLLARCSHLPQVAASAVAAALSAAGVPLEALGPGGREVTRLAGSHSRMWADVALDNDDALLLALDALELSLRAFRAAVESGDPGLVGEWFAQGRAWREASLAPRPAPGFTLQPG